MNTRHFDKLKRYVNMCSLHAQLNRITFLGITPKNTHMRALSPTKSPALQDSATARAQPKSSEESKNCIGQRHGRHCE